ncbi:hypothetical protein L1987_52863 [Smallanthus sonchifolius]|uniref:Uncharacterized protein n=1 Tax=Smallanthus sonchifolius TaxID=185202 RepID=A0ACB9EUX6_9ASTR|nr:hypothetical protein L1987_52863 [Smallanthus sonchifolius]
MERELALLRKGEKKEVAGVKARFDVCEDCGDLGHKTMQCPFQEGRQEEVNQVYGERKQYDMNSNNYHPGLRNHPNFKYGNAANQMNPNFQVFCGIGKTSGANGRRNMRLPSNTTLNPQHQGSSSTNANVSNVTVLHNGKVIDNKVESPPQLVEGVVEDVIEGEESEGEVEFFKDKKPITQNLEKIKPVFRDESPIAKGKHMTGGSVPYLEALVEPFKAKIVNKRGPQQQEMWEMFRQVKINIPLLDAIKQIPAYVKYLKELCTQKRNHEFPKKLNVTANVNVILSGALPPKLQDPGAPIISIQVETSKELEEEEEKRLEAMEIKDGRPPWTHQVESLPEHIDKKLKPSLEQPPKVELKELPKNLKYAL